MTIGSEGMYSGEGRKKEGKEEKRKCGKKEKSKSKKCKAYL